WCFLSLPPEMATEIREALKWQEEGWGRLKARARIGSTEWETAIWFDTRLTTYLLPVKADIRKKENLKPGAVVAVFIFV
ncbi:MAG: DUF1905 domain-containing protein, partial [Bacteroidota bacterium]